MTVPTEINRNNYPATGGENTFPYTFRIFDESELKVYITDTNGVSVLQTLGSDYTVTGVLSYTGGNVTFTDNPTVDYTVSILRQPANTQDTSLQDQSAYSPTSVENALDLLTMQVQAIQGEVNRSIKIPVSEVGITDIVDLPTADNRANMALTFDADGNATVSGEVENVTVSAAMIPVVTASTLAIARDELGVTPNPLISNQTNYVVLSTDRGKVISIDCTASNRTVTLPNADDAGNGFEVSVIKSDMSGNTVAISDTDGNKIGYNGPQFDVAGVTNNGSGFCRVEVDHLSLGGENRIITTGDMVLIAGVGGTTEANGIFSATRVAIGGNWGVDLTSTPFVHAYTIGGTVTLIRTTIYLRVQDSIVTLVSDGSRWIIKNGSLDITTWSRDVLIGHNVDYTGFDKYFNGQARTDFMVDACSKKTHVRTLVVNEVGDPPEVYLRRCETSQTYPDGTPTQVLSGTNLGLINWYGWTSGSPGSYQSRSAQIYARASQDITPAHAGGQLILCTTTRDTASGPTDAVIIDDMQRVNVGANTGSALLSVYNDTDEDKLKVTANSASFTHTIGYFTTATASGTGFYALRCEANAGTVMFSVRGDGLVTHHSATLLATNTALTNGAAAQVATMTNGPTAGNPTKWVPINDNGTTRYIPTW